MGRRAIEDQKYTEALALYMQGLPVAEIADQLQMNKRTLESKIFREKWSVKRLECKTLSKRYSLTSLPDDPDSVSAQMKRQLIETAQHTLDALKRHDPIFLELKELQIRESVIKTVQDRLEILLNWGNETRKEEISYTFLSQMGSELDKQRKEAEAMVSSGETVEAEVISNPMAELVDKANTDN